MRCPVCLAEDTQVKDSRQGAEGRFVKRRRFCTQCNYRFTTHERVETQELIVIKKNGSKKIFDREKLIKAINLAVRKRNIDNEQIELLVDNIVRDLEQSGEAEVSSQVIGAKVMAALSKLDEVAYVRFASVYHDFSDAKDFEKFLHEMVKR